MRELVWKISYKHITYQFSSPEAPIERRGKSREGTGRVDICKEAAQRHSAWRSGLKTGKRPEKDRDQDCKRPDCSPVFSFLRSKDRKKTGLCEPVASVRTGLL